jgi:dTDP-4-dehydrorhamnose reductase
MEKPVIIVSGKNGQLGNELNDLVNNYPQFKFYFFDRTELDIANAEAINSSFEKYKPSYFINTAAYTAVDKAESEQEQAYLINAEATGNIARACKAYSTKLIHVSTDYVFNGQGTQPYKENDPTDPVNYYGYTKWMGEQLSITKQSTDNCYTHIMGVQCVWKQLCKNNVAVNERSYRS